MHSLSSTCLLLPALLAVALPGALAQEACANGAKALYFITNEQANAVVALPVGADGMVSAGTTTATGGSGSSALDANKQPALTDSLVTQSAITVAGNSLFAVNAGSNTVTMFNINPADPTKLTMVGQPVKVPGEFVSTVGASKKNKVVCVGASGAVAGMACSSFSAQGLAPFDALRPFNLGQSTPPVGPTNTVSQVFFSSDESMVFATVKGDPPTNKTGFLASAPVQRASCNRGQAGARARASVSSVVKQSVPDQTKVLFGSQAIPGTKNVFVTDAAFGAAVLSVDAAGEAKTLGVGTIDGQKATCWATISPATGTAFVTDVATNRIVEMSVKDASIVSQLDLSANGDPGLIDLRAAGNFIYALSPGDGKIPAAVTVVDVSGGSGKAKQAQHFQLTGTAGQRSMGMTVFL